MYMCHCVHDLCLVLAMKQRVTNDNFLRPDDGPDETYEYLPDEPDDFQH